MSDPLTIIQGDCLTELAKLPAESVDSIVTDPPYHLTTGKRGGSGEASENLASPAGRSRATTGFMGKTWDGGDVAHDPTVWAEALRVAKPGAHLLAFGGTRTFHRLTCAVEDAGWEIRDCIMWVYGSGFPKSHNGPWGGTALKPAWEPIIVARKPLDGTIAENVEQYGTGGLNIDGCRVGTEPSKTYRKRRDARIFGTGSGGQDVEAPDKGRWPANLIHDGSEDVTGLFPADAGAFAPVRGTEPSAACSGRITGLRARVSTFFHGDIGSAARFFYCAKADRDDREEGMDGAETVTLAQSGGAQQAERKGEQYSAAQSIGLNRVKRVRNNHPTVKPTELMRYLCRLVTPPGGIVLDPFAGSGSTGKAALIEGFRAILIELNPDYCELARRRCLVTPGLPLEA